MSLLDELRARARDFFTNWRGSDAPLPRKLALTVRNRARALARGCCGHPGQPGC
ncbi:MAG: hypothetical protein KatS3mg014_1607 [Actinomycetota bacterium]|nr:MAG: hypothetical protein KatS3mg014_1607 [Actinomycetota bacterium]